MIGLATGIVAVLFAGLWQGVVIGATVLGLLAVVPRATAATKHAILWCGFLAIVVVPLVTVGPQVVHSTTPAGGSVSAYSIVDPGSVPADDLSWLSHAHVTLKLGASAFVVVAVWIVGITIQFVRLVVNLARISQIRRTARQIEMRAETPVCSSEMIAVPIAAGLLKPAVIIPSALWSELSTSDLDCIVLHELAHIRRKDGWSKFLQLVLQTMLFFNPALIVLGRRIGIEREIACDDMAAAGTVEREHFARCIIDLAERVSLAPASALGALGIRNATALRIRRLLDSRHDGRRFISRPLLGGVLMLLATIALAFQTLVPVVAFATPTAPVAPVAPISAKTATSRIGPVAAAATCTRPAWVLRPAVPVYPPSTRGAAARSAIIAVRLSASGSVVGTKVAKSSGRGDLDAAATTAARASTYSPAVARCKPVAGTYGFYVRFN